VRRFTKIRASRYTRAPLTHRDRIFWSQSRDRAGAGTRRITAGKARLRSPLTPDGALEVIANLNLLALDGLHREEPRRGISWSVCARLPRAKAVLRIITCEYSSSRPSARAMKRCRMMSAHSWVGQDPRRGRYRQAWGWAGRTVCFRLAWGDSLFDEQFHFARRCSSLHRPSAWQAHERRTTRRASARRSSRRSRCGFACSEMRQPGGAHRQPPRQKAIARILPPLCCRDGRAG